MACRRHSLNKPKIIKIAYILPTNTVTDQSPRPLSNVKLKNMDRQTRAKRIADLHVFYGQNEVVGELIRAGKIDEEYTYPFVDTEEEICHWWGRTTSGQAIYMDGVIQKIAGE